MTNQERNIVAFLAGAAIGAVAGVLFAPDKGSETRKKIADSADKLSDSVKEKAMQGLDVISELKEKIFHAENGNGKTEVY